MKTLLTIMELDTGKKEHRWKNGQNAQDEEGLLKGRVTRAVGGFYTVMGSGGERVVCRARGKFRLEGTIYVGDLVRYSLTPDGQGIIEEILPRKNVLKRPYVANVDRVIIVFSFRNPQCHRLLIDRFLLLAAGAGLESLLVFNKADLADPAEQEEQAGPYRKIGYNVLCTSTVTGQGRVDLLRATEQKVTFLAGPSGVGKSALINMIEPGFRLRTGEVSRKIGRGRHTTRQAELLSLPGGAGFIADTPGFSRLDLDFIEDHQHLAALFPEFSGKTGNCRFTGCRHLQEPGCAVKEALACKEIYPWRYEHYVLFLQEIEKRAAEKYSMKQ